MKNDDNVEKNDDQNLSSQKDLQKALRQSSEIEACNENVRIEENEWQKAMIYKVNENDSIDYIEAARRNKNLSPLSHNENILEFTSNQSESHSTLRDVFACEPVDSINSEDKKDDKNCEKNVDPEQSNSKHNNDNFEKSDQLKELESHVAQINDPDISERISKILGKTDALSNDEDNVHGSALRYIVDFESIDKGIKQTYLEHVADGRDCSIRSWTFIREKTFYHGNRSRFHYKCEACGYTDAFWSEPAPSAKYMGINKSLVTGCAVKGIGHTQLQELLASANIHTMTDNMFISEQQKVLADFEKCAFDSMAEAAREEREHAIKIGHVTKEGIPFITVTTDGSWLKRTYGFNYNSHSGMAAIIGMHTGKVLHVGIRNKYCTTCHRGLQHKYPCYKNWEMAAPSTAMETDAILEGFKCSVANHNLIYRTIVTDGDSSVYNAIIDSKVYSEYGIIPKKICCSNHLLKNLVKKIIAIKGITQKKGERVPGFVKYRTIVVKRREKLRAAVKERIAYRVAQSLTFDEKAKALQKDILNVPSHIFGEHEHCKEYGFSCQMIHESTKETEKGCSDSEVHNATVGESEDENEDNLNENEIPEVESENETETFSENIVPELRKHGFYAKITEAFEYLSKFSNSLLHQLTNNASESLNGLVSASLGGKRIHFGLRSQYNMRIYAAVIQHNSQKVLSELYKATGKDVSPIIENVECKRLKKRERTRNARKEGRKGYNRSRRRGMTTDRHYGPNCTKEDMLPNEVEAKADEIFETLEKNQKNRAALERETIGQSTNEKWIAARRFMLTASNFGPACRWKDSISCIPTVQRILYSKPEPENIAVQHGILQEKVALEKLRDVYEEPIEECGIFIDKEYSFLGASPDALIGLSGTIEIKSTFQGAHLSAEDAINEIRSVAAAFDKKDQQKLSQTHDHYFQIQGQLHITGREYCLYVIHTSVSQKITKVLRDDNFWSTKMEPRLTKFYMDCLLPEIIDPRQTRSRQIRNPYYTREAIQQRKSKTAAKKSELSVSAPKKIKISDISDPVNVSGPVSSANDVEFVRELDFDKNMTLFDIWSFIRNLDNQYLDEDLVIQNVTPIDNQLNDTSLDWIMRKIQNLTEEYELKSVHYQRRLPLVTEATQSCIQIIGGETEISGKLGHWRTLLYDADNLTIRVFDSAGMHRLKDFEQRYIAKRFPRVAAKDIIFEPMKVHQQDATSCGVFAAAYAVDLLLGNDPKDVSYSSNRRLMRDTFLEIVRTGNIQPFPREET